MSCSATEEIYDDLTSPDYVSSSKARRLEIPPDLSELEQSDSYNVPGEAKSYKDFLDKEQALQDNNLFTDKKPIITNPEGMKIIKSGNLRWLVISKEPGVIWPHVNDFWEDLGFRILVSNKKTGIIETEWMDTDDIKLDSNSGALSTFDKWLDSLSGFADKRKFRTRIEYGDDNSTEIYISQRSAEAAADQHSRILKERDSGYNASTIYKIDDYKSDDSKNNTVDIKETRELDDYEIDSELLTRLMIKLGATDFSAREKVNNPEIMVKANLINNENNLYIKMLDPYDRAWRRLGLALDIIGFVTEDKNRRDGIYYVRFSELDLPKENPEEESLIDSLIFWGEDESELEEKSIEKTEEILETDEVITDNDFSGIELPEIKPIDEDYVPDEFIKQEKFNEEEETWISNLWPSWGGKEEQDALPDNEKRYRVRIKSDEDNTAIVYLDYPNEKINDSKDARKVLSIIYNYLK